jgi:DNA-binding Lrp family transcriptional regulator
VAQDIAERLSISPTEITGRVQALRHSGAIGPFRAAPFLPALHGGEWTRYVVRLYKLDLDLERRLVRNLSGLEESLHNAVFFTRRFPTTSLFCFTKTREELQLTLREAGIEEEPLHVLSYNFPFSASLSGEERLLLRTINSTGEAIPSLLAGYLDREPSWVEAKLRRLVLHSDNPQGVAILRTSIHWYRIDNFIHAHILLPAESKSHLPAICRGLEWSILKWPGQSSETIAVEADFRGWGHFAEWRSYAELAGFSPLGFALAAEERIHAKGFEF